ncbi:MAG: hydrogenase maturation protease [Pseudomonadota bacterium]
MSVRQLVLGVGNAIMTDDAVGIATAEVLARVLAHRAGVEVRFSERGGFDLMDLLDGCDHAVVVDAYLVPGEEPGTVLTRSVEDFLGSHHLYAAHGVDLPTALRLGRELGGDMPSRVDIVGVVVEDPYTVSERMTPAVAAAVQPAVERVLALLDGQAS